MFNLFSLLDWKEKGRWKYCQYWNTNLSNHQILEWVIRYKLHCWHYMSCALSRFALSIVHKILLLAKITPIFCQSCCTNLWYSLSPCPSIGTRDSVRGQLVLSCHIVISKSNRIFLLNSIWIHIHVHGQYLSFKSRGLHETIMCLSML